MIFIKNNFGGFLWNMESAIFLLKMLTFVRNNPYTISNRYIMEPSYRILICWFVDE